MSRLIATVVNFVKMGEEDHLDVIYWRSKSYNERLAEVVRLRRSYYTWLNGSYPDKIEKVITIRKNDV